MFKGKGSLIEFVDWSKLASVAGVSVEPLKLVWGPQFSHCQKTKMRQTSIKGYRNACYAGLVEVNPQSFLESEFNSSNV